MTKFHADGRRIFKSPIQTRHEDGKETFSLGFPVIEVMEHVSNAEELAKVIAEILSQSDRL